MKVILEEALFSQRSQKARPFQLFSIFEVCLRRRHVVAMAPPTRSQCEAWLTRLSADHRYLVETVLSDSFQGASLGTTESEIVASDEPTDWRRSPPHVGPDDILDLLHTPLTILVENALADAAFLRTMAFETDASAFSSCISARRIDFAHGGGSDMKDLIRERGADRPRAQRTFVVFDSDALVPERPSKEAEAKVAVCEEAKIRYHRLRRRAIENYLPPDELNRLIPHSPASIEARKMVGSFGRLNPPQRAHYNLKTGFAGDRSRLERGDAEQRPAVQRLFSGIQEKDLKGLEKGFGRNIAAYFRGGISEASRLRDGQAEEMNALFRAILRWL